MARWNAIIPEEGSKVHLDAKRLEVFNNVLTHMADEGMSLRSACKQPDTDTKPSTILRWIADDEMHGDGLLACMCQRSASAAGDWLASRLIQIAGEQHPCH